MRVQLFATCLGDLVFPDAVADAEALLRGAGFELEFPAAQVCCGQPAFNAGHRWNGNAMLPLLFFSWRRQVTD